MATGSGSTLPCPLVDKGVFSPAPASETEGLGAGDPASWVGTGTDAGRGTGLENDVRAGAEDGGSVSVAATLGVGREEAALSLAFAWFWTGPA